MMHGGAHRRCAVWVGGRAAGAGQGWVKSPRGPLWPEGRRKVSSVHGKLTLGSVSGERAPPAEKVLKSWGPRISGRPSPRDSQAARDKGCTPARRGRVEPGSGRCETCRDAARLGPGTLDSSEREGAASGGR